MKREQQIVSMPVNVALLTLGSADLEYQRLPFWVASATGNNFAWLHLPFSGSGNVTGVIICSPLGYEYTHSHRSVRHIADQLALHGYPTLRFDLHGMGDSAGDLFAEDLLQRWIADINAAIESVKSSTGVGSICLFGIRMGATLAAKVAEHTAIEHLVLWNPCVSGGRYVREMQALDWLSERAGKGHDDYVESAGFIMTTDMATKIKNIDLAKQSYNIAGKVLVVHRDDLALDTELPTTLREKGVPVDEITATGYANMMAEPQDTEVPAVAIADVVGWLDANKQPGRLDYSDTLSVDYKHEVTLLHHDNKKLTEKICLLGQKRNIFGILSQPAQPLALDRPLIVLLNSGSVHHVGPNRLYVELCRALSAAGFACLRIDLANLGDSVVGRPDNENHPYPDHANDDVEAVLGSVTKELGFQHIVLAGLCSGAHTAFRAGLHNAKVCESIVINPLTFYWHEGMSLEIPHAHQSLKDAKYYEGAMRDKRKWLKLLKGQVELGYILHFVAKHLKQQFAHRIRYLRAITGVSATSRLGMDLDKYKQAGRRLSFFFSTTDPGYDILMSEAPHTAKKHIKRGVIDVVFIEDADHTFSEKRKRDELIDKIRTHLARRYTKDLSNAEDAR